MAIAAEAAGGFFADRLAEFGDAPALIPESGAAVSYRALADAADAFAGGLGKDRALVVIEAENSVEAVTAYLGALRGRHPAILTGGGADATQRLIESYRPDWHYRCEDGVWRLGRLDGEPGALHSELALMLSTSGTTGATKLVRLSRANLDANARSIASYLDLAADDRPITSLAIHYSYGLSVLNSHLATGAAVLLTGRSLIEPEFWEFFDRDGATSLAGVPYSYEMLERMAFRGRASPPLRTLTQAGGRLPPELVAKYAEWAEGRGVRFFVMYGQTEATARISYVPPEALRGNEATIGIAIPGGALHLIDEAGQPSASGELVYRGPNVMLGYAEARGDLAKGREIEELRTGDLAVREANGFFRITGRNSRFSKLFGLRVSLDEVEAALGRMGIAGAAAGNDALVAVAYLGDADAGEVRRGLAEALALPTEAFEAECVEDLPLLPSGKVDYRTILARAEARRERRKLAPEGDSFEPLFAAAFPGLAIAPEDSFVGLGGDSLVYVTLAGEIEDRLGSLPPEWESMSIASLNAMAERGNPRAGKWMATIDSEILLRALAILAVVINHASTMTVGGGAGALLMLAGFNLARFQRARFVAGRFWEAVASFAWRVVLPVWLIVLVFALVRENPGVSSFLLVSNFEGRYRSILEPFWFIETLFQLLLLVGAISFFPAARRFAGAAPLGFGLGLLLLAIAMRLGGPLVFDHSGLAGRTPDQLFFLAALGWCAYFARSMAVRLAVFGGTLVFAALHSGFLAVPGWIASDAPHRQVWLVCGMVLLLFVPRIPAPAVLRRLVMPIAAASFTIYVTHGLPAWLIDSYAGIEWEAAKVIAAVVLGLIVHRLAATLVRRVRVSEPAAAGPAA